MTALERWLPVVGYEGIYEVSDLGNVRRLPAPRIARAPRLLRPRPTSKGYVRVALHCGGAETRDEQAIHRLVAFAFLGPAPGPGWEVNHKDGVKTNNHVANLEWMTPVDNSRHALDTGLRTPLRGEQQGRAKLTWEQADEIRCSTEGKKVLARRYGVSTFVIYGIRTGKGWKEEHRPVHLLAGRVTATPSAPGLAP